MLPWFLAGITGNPVIRAVIGTLSLVLTVLVAIKVNSWRAASAARRDERRKANEADLRRAHDISRRSAAAFRRVLRPDEIVYRD
jgi:hypothetical protein